MGLIAYLSIELSCSFSHWFTPKASQLILEPLQYLCHHPQEPVYVSLPLDTHPFVFLRYWDCIPDTLRVHIQQVEEMRSNDEAI